MSMSKFAKSINLLIKSSHKHVKWPYQPQSIAQYSRQSGLVAKYSDRFIFLRQPSSLFSFVFLVSGSSTVLFYYFKKNDTQSSANEAEESNNFFRSIKDLIHESFEWINPFSPKNESSLMAKEDEGREVNILHVYYEFSNTLDHKKYLKFGDFFNYLIKI